MFFGCLFKNVLLQRGRRQRNGGWWGSNRNFGRFSCYFFLLKRLNIARSQLRYAAIGEQTNLVALRFMAIGMNSKAICQNRIFAAAGRNRRQ